MYTGRSRVSDKILLHDVLVIPDLKKKLLSVNKLILDYLVDVLFSQLLFTIQDRQTKQVLAKRKCRNGLYVLKEGPQSFVANHGVTNRASYKLWYTQGWNTNTTNTRPESNLHN